MRTKHLLIALSAVALLAGACANNPADTGAPATAAASAGTATAASVPGSAAASAAGPAASIGTCRPEAPTATSANWSTLQAHGGDYSFKFPASWDKLYGAFVFSTRQLLDAQTFAETGLPATDPTRADLVRLPTVGLPNASVLIVPGVVSSTATVFARQVGRFSAIADIKVIATNLVACIGGDRALGASFTFNKDTTYQESWYVVRGGRSYDVQWLAPKGNEQTDLFREMFRTWQWTPDVPASTPRPFTSAAPATAAPSGVPTATPGTVPTAGASGGPTSPPTTAPTSAPTASAGPTSFVVAGMATSVDPKATAANPKDFVTTIPKEATTIYAVFAMKKGLTGQVNGVLKQGDKSLVTLSLQYAAKNTWGDFRINSAKGIAVGAYTMVITFVPTGETITLPFSVK